MSVIRFKREYRRRLPGALDDQMTYGMHDALVMRGVAEWVDQSVEGVIAVVEDVPIETPRDKKRRFSSKE